MSNKKYMGLSQPGPQRFRPLPCCDHLPQQSDSRFHH